jgi:hypothetical protein
MPALETASKARLQIGTVDLSQELSAGADRATFKSVPLPARRVRVEATVERAGHTVGAHYVDLECHEPAAAP